MDGNHVYGSFSTEKAAWKELWRIEYSWMYQDDRGPSVPDFKVVEKVLYEEPINRKKASEFKIDKIKKEYIEESEVVMSELLRNYKDLTREEIKELLEWSGDDEYVSVDDIIRERKDYE